MSTLAMTEQRFEQHVTARGLADTLAALPPRVTISPRTLVAAGIPPSLAIGVTSPAPKAPVHTPTANLPRIELARASASASMEASRQSASGPDLEVVGTLGEGGMGRVLLARQHSLARDVAIKTLKNADDAASSGPALLEEARIAGALEHPGIVPVHALGLDDAGLPLLVMKRVEGVSFRVLLDDPTHPAWHSVSRAAMGRVLGSIEILMRVCEALAFAHDRGIVHRDIKPENILVGNYGEVYLCDWGIATHIEDAASSAGMLAGTLLYMAPEMLLGEPVDARTDVYLLGATLHEVLTGRTRHQGASMREIMYSIATSAPFDYDPAIATDLARLCNKATAADPAQRPASPEAFRKELAEYLHRRSAMALCEAAFESMRGLETLLANAPLDAPPEDLAGAYRKATEARFGFVQSLRVHPDLDAAKQGLERMLVCAFDLELRQKHVKTAAALLDEMANPTPELAKRLSAARDAAEARRLEAERLQAIARDLDPAVAARSRMMMLGSVALCGFALAIGILFRTFRTLGAEVSSADLVSFAGLTLAFNLVGIAIFHRRVFETLFNRRMVAFVVLLIIMMLSHRIMAWRDQEKVSDILSHDTLMFTAVTTIGAVIFHRRIISVAIVCGATLIAIRIEPAQTVMFFQIMTLVVVPAALWAWKAPN